MESGRLKAGFLNATTLHKHMVMFRQFLCSAHPFYHFFGVAETRFGHKVDDVFAQVDGYSILRQDRNRHAGGVALYMDNSYKASLLCSSPTQVKGKPGILEYLMCRVQRGELPPVFVAVVYSPPDSSFSCFKDSDLFTNLTKHSKGYDYRIVMSDLNANMLSTSQKTNFIRDFVCEHNFKLVN